MSCGVFFHSPIILRAVINCISFAIISSKELCRRSVYPGQSHGSGCGHINTLLWIWFLQLASLVSSNVQACISQAERLVAALLTNLSLAHVFLPQKVSSTGQGVHS